MSQGCLGLGDGLGCRCSVPPLHSLEGASLSSVCSDERGPPCDKCSGAEGEAIGDGSGGPGCKGGEGRGEVKKCGGNGAAASACREKG
jgi:hypothetical protein